MDPQEIQRLVQLDHQYLWHPFTQMKDWLESEPIIIESGEGALLKDVKGNTYLDANSSIWVNLHGHNQEKINQNLIQQLQKIAHSSFLGLTNIPAIQLAEKLVEMVRITLKTEPDQLNKVFYSDNGSTAMEVALKMAFQMWKHRGQKKRNKFLTLHNGYHGDTIGSVSLGGIDTFHAVFKPLLFPTEQALTPACYRCPYNRARPEKADARTYRKCHWECVDEFAMKLNRNQIELAGVVVEPRVQGAAGMLMHPHGYLSKIAALARSRQMPLIVDEVLTGFGRTGTMLACAQEGVIPDFLALSKGLTGGYMPLAATLTSQHVYESFLGDYTEKKSFFHGHSYTGNQLGCSAALANLDLFESNRVIASIQPRIEQLTRLSQKFWQHPNVGDVRQEGMILAIELVEDFNTRKPFPWELKVGIRICQELAKLGILNRPLGNTLVILPPLTITENQLAEIADKTLLAINTVLGI